MNKTKVYVVLAILALSIAGLVIAQESTSIWTGCVSNDKGSMYGFQQGANPLVNCKSGDHIISFYDRTFIDVLSSKINNLTNQSDNITSQVGDLSSSVNESSVRIDNLTSQINVLINKVNNLTNLTEIKAYTDQTSNRAFWIVYTNNDPVRWIHVTIQSYYAHSSGNANNCPSVYILSDSSNSPITMIAGNINTQNPQGTSNSGGGEISAYIKPGENYMVGYNSCYASEAPIIGKWMEMLS